MMGDGNGQSGKHHGQTGTLSRSVRHIMGTGEADKANKVTVVGFASSTADIFTLLERLESKLDRSTARVEAIMCGTCQGWRTDKYASAPGSSLIVL
jgi:ATP-dependent protease HslVU (ClpYQ) peptidase subunit